MPARPSGWTVSPTVAPPIVAFQGAMRWCSANARMRAAASSMASRSPRGAAAAAALMSCSGTRKASRRAPSKRSVSSLRAASPLRRTSAMTPRTASSAAPAPSSPVTGRGMRACGSERRSMVRIVGESTGGTRSLRSLDLSLGLGPGLGLDLAAGSADDRAEHHRQPGAPAGWTMIGAIPPQGIGRLAIGAEQHLHTTGDQPRPRRGTLEGVRLALAALLAGHGSSIGEMRRCGYDEPQTVRP